MTETTDARPEAAPAPPAAPPPQTVRDRILGVVGIAAIVLAVVFLFVGEGDDGAAVAESAPIPAIALLHPADGAEVSGAFPVEFETGAEMRAGPMGWVAEGVYHLHALIDGTELMARTGDIQALGGRRYRWTIPPLPAGEHTLRLQWSGPDHRTIPESGSPPVRVVAR